MARKKKRKTGWFRILLLFLLVPLTVWFAALVIWFYWYDLNSWLRPDHLRRAQPSAARQREPDEKRETSAAKQPKERILDDDRKTLEDILKRHN
jgi:hypothetical protein